MDDEEQLTSRGRSQRSRRPPKQYQGTLSWNDAKRLVQTNEREADGEDEAMQEGDGDNELVGGDEDEVDVEDDGDLSQRSSSLMDEDQDDDGNTSDEFVPEATRSSQSARQAKLGNELPGEDFGSDSGEEYDSSHDDSDEEEKEEEAEGRSGAAQLRVALQGALIDGIPRELLSGSQQHASSLTTTERLERAKKRRWYPPAGYGGMEAPAAWKEAGLRNRQAQRELFQDEEAEAEVEVEEDELHDLASIFAGDGGPGPGGEDGISSAQIDRWQSALHERQGASDEEDLDEAGFDQDLRGAAGFRQRATRDKRGVVRRAPREQTLSAPVRALLSEANFAYIEPDLPKTIAKLKDVIKLEPAVRSAWATLALCFQESGDAEKALQSRIMEAHLTYRPIALWEELATSSREMGFNEQAVYCLSKAITSSREKDRIDVLDIMWERGQLLEEMNESRRAAHSYMHMLQYRPQNQNIIRQLIPLLFQLDMIDRAIEILQRCEEWNMTSFPDPLLDPAMMDAGPDVRNTYESSEVVTLADLLLRAGRPLEALHTIRRGARWLDGRANEEFWDDVLNDDREFDESREEGDREGEGDYGRRVELAPIHYLEPEFRFQLAVARARIGDGEEAARHFEIWQSNASISDHVEHYSDMAEEYTRLGQSQEKDQAEKRKWFDVALSITSQTIHERQSVEGAEYDADSIIADYKRLAQCYVGLGDSKEAIAWLKEVVKYDPHDFESKLKLAEAYEETGDRETAIEIVTQVVKAKRSKQIEAASAGRSASANDETLTQSLSFIAEIHQRATRDGEGSSKQSMREQRKELERIRELESTLAWKRLKAIEAKVFVKEWWSVRVEMQGDARRRRYGDREGVRLREERFANVSEWLSDAERLVTMFQNTTQLYPRNRTKKFSGVLRTKRKKADLVDTQASAILARLGDDLLDDGGQVRDTYEHATFRGIKLDDWVTLLMQYAFLLTKVGEYDSAREMVERIIKSNVIWSNEKRKESMRLCLASCALYAQDYTGMVEMIRTLTYEYQFHNEPLRILLTLGNSTGAIAFAVFNQPHNLKNFLRRSRIHEAIVQGSGCKFSSTGRRWVVDEDLFAKFKSGRDNEGYDYGGDDTKEGGEGDNDNDNDNNDDDDDDDDEDAPDSGAEAAGSVKSRETNGPAQEVWKTLQLDSSISAAKHAPPTKYDPANDMLYASMLLTSTTGVPSMGYWMRAYARQQSDPLICLAAAIACLGRAQNRQVDNRHQVIVQAFTFLHHYRAIRLRQGHSASEVEYNFGRAFHLVGLYQLAVPHYQKVLTMHDADIAAQTAGKSKANAQQRETQCKQTGFQSWPEAAYNLSLVFLHSGNSVLANQVVEKYLRV